MPDMINLVATKIQDKYHLFGAAVGLDESYLRALLIDYPNCLLRFVAVLHEWKDNYPDTFSWSTVINVLLSDAIGATEVAKDVIRHVMTKTTT